jgi:hypothetical protein
MTTRTITITAMIITITAIMATAIPTTMTTTAGGMTMTEAASVIDRGRAPSILPMPWAATAFIPGRGVDHGPEAVAEWMAEPPGADDW